MASLVQLDVSDIEVYPRLSVYSRLDANRREIRLIRLGNNVELQVYSLDAAPPYHALSYHWGPAAPTRCVLFQGELIEIRETVAEMLEVMRYRYGSEEFFWIDSLCINQCDRRERNSQVSMMADIYLHASDVVTWLGGSTSRSHTAFKIIENELQCPKHAPWRLLRDESLNYHFEAADEDWPSTEQLEADQLLYKHFSEIVVWPALSDLIRRPYWDRMWVVQEIIVAAKSVVICGRDMTSLEKLVKIGSGWVKKSQSYQENDISFKLEAVNHTKYQDVINQWRPIEKLLEYREQFKDDKILLLELVDSFAIKKCSDIRDKVYALRSLSSEAAFIEVDYSKSVLEVFLDILHCGLLMSDGGRGFQSLPHLIRCMGLEHDRLSEQLLEVPSVLIPLRGSMSGSVLEVNIYTAAEKNGETTGNHQLRLTIIKVGMEGKQQTDIHHLLRDSRTGISFLRHARPCDVLCTIPTQDPILVLLRPICYRNTEMIYQAISNLHNWGYRRNTGNSEKLEEAYTSGELIIEEYGNSQPSEYQRFLVDSRSLSALTLWKQTSDKWYVVK